MNQSDRTKIVLRNCEDYSNAERVLNEVLDDLNLKDECDGRKVLIKINLMLGADPSLGTNTHPKVAQAITKYIVAHGGTADVADSSGALGLTEACFERSGIANAVNEVGGRIINFDFVDQHIVDIQGKVLGEIVLPAILDEYDLIISVAKWKVHPLMGMTGAMKNMMGIVPGAEKPWIHHKHARTMPRLSQALLDLYAAYKPSYSIMDGIIGREGGGSTSGRAVKGNLIGASRDGLALDAACAYLMGLDRQNVPMIDDGAKRDLGNADPDKWDIQGDFPFSKGVVTFEPSPIDKKANRILGGIAYYLRDHAVRPQFPQSGCSNCDDCVNQCPTNSLEKRNGRIVRNKATCIGCYHCIAACKDGKALLKVAFWAKKMFWKKAEGLNPAHFLAKDK